MQGQRCAAATILSVSMYHHEPSNLRLLPGISSLPTACPSVGLSQPTMHAETLAELPHTNYMPSLLVMCGPR